MLNKKEIEKVAERLQEIGLTCYFIGGSIVAIYADNIGTFEQRVTKDIDVDKVRLFLENINQQ